MAAELKDLEKQELDPQVYSNMQKAKTIGRKKREIQDLLALLSDTTSSLEFYWDLATSLSAEELVRVLVEAKDKKNEYDISDVDLSGFVRE